MAEKVFIKQDSYSLIGDERDIMLPMGLSKQVREWCESNDIKVEQNQLQIILQTNFGVTLWRVRDEQQRMWFALRWAG